MQEKSNEDASVNWKPYDGEIIKNDKRVIVWDEVQVQADEIMIKNLIKKLEKAGRKGKKGKKDKKKKGKKDKKRKEGQKGKEGKGKERQRPHRQPDNGLPMGRTRRE